ncbi:HlyD family efflux transporter periplasmic adaptor subunit [Novilysobacter antarcticus]|uniref:HlyD family efflux transporter periplasmic adaptor subunit n=1 Tax=Novilysobacter antarcticus TaxID=2862543 RepID=UPI001C99B79F|nr:HlyD family efflux transporter periplasmic adaptor subunit [Lysobacter antarcticus]
MSTESTPAARPATPATSAAKGMPGKRRMALLIVLAVVVLTVAGWLAWYLLIGRWYENTDDAYVQGNVVAVTPQTAGTVVSIGVDDGMMVTAGQVLVQLDPHDAQMAYQQAVANLAGTVRQVRGLYSAVDAGQATVAAQQAALTRARADVARREGLVASGAVSSEELAHARDQLAAAEAALSVSHGDLSRNRALVDATTVQSQPQVQAAAARLRQAYLDSQRTQILAPISGHVAQRHVQLGQRVQPGTTLMTVVPSEQMWVEANFKETQLANMRIGQPVEVRADLYGNKVTYRGTVGSLGMGTGSAFALLPAQNASGNWIKIVQRLPVRINLEREQLAKYPLRIGLSMSVDVDIHDDSGQVLAGELSTAPVLSTAVYADQIGDADALIERIVQDNLSQSGTRD